MVQLLYGEAEVPRPSEYSDVAITHADVESFGGTAYVAEQAVLEAQRVARIEAERLAEVEARLEKMEFTAEQAHEEYYAPGGVGHGTTPGGPDVVYFSDKYGSTVAEGVYEVLHPIAESQLFQPAFWEEKIPEKTDILLYGALAIGALALLKR